MLNRRGVQINDPKISLASIFESTVAPDNQCEISSKVGALQCSLIIVLFKLWVSRHILSDPSGFVGYVSNETHSVGHVAGTIIWKSSISLSFSSIFLCNG